MINIILITFTGFVAWTSFRAGAKYKTLPALWADAKNTLKRWAS